MSYSIIFLTFFVCIDKAVQWFNEDLKERYIDMGLAKSDEESDPWPPVKITSFSSLAFMCQKSHYKQKQ